MNIQVPPPVKLCNLCFSDRGLLASIINGFVVVLPTATQEQVDAVLAYLAVATPCPHVFISQLQQDASDAWVELNAKLAAIPAGADYDAVRARYAALVAAVLDKANAAGGLA